jgi:succinyl-diaminopimelate desuccinylase
VLDGLADGLDEGCARKLPQLRQLVVGIDSLGQHCCDEPALQRGLRLAGNHTRIMPSARQNPGMDAAEGLAQRTLELVSIPSESRHEDEIAAYVRAAVPLPFLHESDEVLFYGLRTGRPFVVLAGHLDTVPAQGNLPGRLQDGVVYGLGASDMKSGLAVIVELARTLRKTELDVGYLFFTREELSAEVSPLPAFFDACADVHDAELVVVLEPTDNEIHAGCLGNLTARVAFEGVSAHSARPWLGENAIHKAIAGLADVPKRQPLDVEVDGLIFREVVSVVRIEGGIAQNVVPARATAELNYRYAPHRAPEDAERRLRELVPDGIFEAIANSPPAHVVVDTPLARRLRDAGEFEIAPKQAWTPVAQFAERGLDAVNLGPGATRYAHAIDEQVEVAEIARTCEALARFLGTV